MIPLRECCSLVSLVFWTKVTQYSQFSGLSVRFSSSWTKMFFLRVHGLVVYFTLFSRSSDFVLDGQFIMWKEAFWVSSIQIV